MAALVMALVVTALAACVVGVATAQAVHAETLRKVLASPLAEEGSPPDGCVPVLSGLGGPVVWAARVERLLLDGKGLVETTQQADPNRFPLCIADLPVVKNAQVELSFVNHDGKVARAAGIVLRFSDPQDFYAVEADALDGTVRFVRVLKGERRQLGVKTNPQMIG